MATRINTGLQDELAGAAGDSFDNGSLIVQTGAQPANANDALAGTALATITLPADAFGAPATGVVSKAGTWTATVGTTGAPGSFRMRNAGDTLRLDGAAAAAASDLNISGLVEGELISGGTLTIDTFTITMPAS